MAICWFCSPCSRHLVPAIAIALNCHDRNAPDPPPYNMKTFKDGGGTAQYHDCRPAIKVPYYFETRDSPFVNLAGIYSITPDNYTSFSILTKEAEPGSKYATIHNKKNRDGEHRQVVPLADDRVEALAVGRPKRGRRLSAPAQRFAGRTDPCLFHQQGPFFDEGRFRPPRYY